MNQLWPLVNIWGPFDPETIWDVLGTQGQPGTTRGFSSDAQKSQPSIVETARRRRKETLEAAFHRKSRVLCGQFADPVSSGPGAMVPWCRPTSRPHEHEQGRRGTKTNLCGFTTHFLYFFSEKWPQWPKFLKTWSTKQKAGGTLQFKRWRYSSNVVNPKP